MQNDRETVVGSNIDHHSAHLGQKPKSSGKPLGTGTKVLIAFAIIAMLGTGVMTLLLAFLVGPLLGGPSFRSGRTQAVSFESLPVRSVPVKLTVGKPLTHYNMTLFPVYRPDNHPAGKSQLGRQANTSRYLSLGEALARKQLTVKEKPDAQVSEVHLTNKSSRAVYLIAGDIILGGQQDREIARDTIVPAKAREYAVEVFCVEEGRWNGKSHFTRGEVASSSLRYETQYSKKQSSVWDRVKKEAYDTHSYSDSGTYRAVAANTASQAQITAYTGDFSQRLRKDQRVLGLVAAINGEIVVADVFGDPHLFQQQLPTLLKSYALDAVQQKVARAKDTKKPRPSRLSAERFLKDGETGGQRMNTKTGATINSERENKTTITFDAMIPASSKNPKDMNEANLAHRNIFRKQSPETSTRRTPSD